MGGAEIREGRREEEPSSGLKQLQNTAHGSNIAFFA
jgi:hypothetical protein